MPKVNEIIHRDNQNLYSIQCMPKKINYQTFTPDTEFEKCAAVKVEKYTDILME